MKLLAISTGSVMLTLLALILSMFTFLFLYLPIAENKEFQADFGSELGSEILTCYLREGVGGGHLLLPGHQQPLHRHGRSTL